MESSNGNHEGSGAQAAHGSSERDASDGNGDGDSDDRNANAVGNAELNAMKQGKKVAIAAFVALAAWFIVSSVAQVSCHALRQPAATAP